MKLCLGCMKEIKETEAVCPYCGYKENTPVEEAYYLNPGTILADRYLIGKVLGYGGFGITYIGWDPTLQRIIAVKEYFPSEYATRGLGNKRITIYNTGDAYEQFQMGLDSFITEAKRLAQLHSVEGVVRIYDCIRENDTGYIIMEYLNGETIKEVLGRGKKYSYEKALKIIISVLNTLSEVHKEGIIHRDIAPDNIFITKEGAVKLLDFGAARYAASTKSRSLSVILKPGYAPEEQYRSHGQQGPWTDVYATGATFYKMITGVLPEESIERIAEDNLIPPSKLGAEISPAQENVLLVSLKVRPTERYQTADEFKKALLSVNRQTPPEPPEPPQNPIFKKIIISSAIFIAASIGIMAWYIPKNKSLSETVLPLASSGNDPQNTVKGIVPSVSPDLTPTDMPTSKPTETLTPTPIDSPTPIPEPTEIPVPTPTNTPMPTPKPTETPVPTPTNTPTLTPEPTETPVPTPTNTPTPTPEPTETPAPTPTNTPTPTPEPTETPAPTPTNTPTPPLEQTDVPASTDTPASQEASEPVQEETEGNDALAQQVTKSDEKEYILTYQIDGKEHKVTIKNDTDIQISQIYVSRSGSDIIDAVNPDTESTYNVEALADANEFQLYDIKISGHVNETEQSLIYYSLKLSDIKELHLCEEDGYAYATYEISSGEMIDWKPYRVKTYNEPETYYALANGLNVRRLPDTGAGEKIGKYALGETITIYGDARGIENGKEASWYLVKTPSSFGFVSANSQYLTNNKETVENHKTASSQANADNAYNYNNDYNYNNSYSQGQNYYPSNNGYDYTDASGNDDSSDDGMDIWDPFGLDDSN